jgi:hypothetical protein
MANFDILIQNPEIAKNIRFEITGADLLSLAGTIIKATREATLQETKKGEVYVDIKEAARQLKRDKSTLWKWGKQGILKHNAIGLYKQSDIDKILKQ